MSHLERSRRSALILVLVVFLLPLTGREAAALQITVTFSGLIDGVSDNTGSLVGSDVTAGVSTFTGAFSYDSSSAPTFQSGGTAYYPSAPFEITIDGAHVFQASVPLSFRIQNDDPNFYDTFEFFANSGAVFPFPYNANDQLLRVSLRDATNSVFSNTSLPTSLDLSDFSTREVFIRTDLDRDAGQLWIISGHITSLATTVPEPVSALLLALATAALVGARWQTKSRASQPR